MSFFKFPLAATLFLALVLPTFVQAQTTALSEKEKIEALINLVSQLKTAKFVRPRQNPLADQGLIMTIGVVVEQREG